ncbi:DUF7009 family protein [Pseudemcibacter aquimaris]|uniref:DUF7009 family protein n=1 Tax=Pseudemcibacter aquimaris TaxID=2857064 RepID=UPI002010D3B5|nr:hypothetical protein [Pseudemcibacter aquimaris]MCC3862058.1 hypothetical protein [Pseudemcibacter aquimaris]WDU58810.1 hypothetical protein KW060_00795 [Pseudemcibacter aquimaris]
MKLRIEPKKTTLRLSKAEFQSFLDTGELSQITHFPGGGNISISAQLDHDPSFMVKDNRFQIKLPNHLLREYKPSKSGISFEFQLDNGESHELVFEVDIKKKPLNK